MDCDKRCQHEHLMGNNRPGPRRRGPSSFFMHDPELVFHELKLKEGDSFLDLGCGVGDYSLYASKIVGGSGEIYALDIREELIDSLAEEAALQRLENIRTMVSDIDSPLPVADNYIDICFIATVLHLFDLDKDGKTLFKEIRRVLKPSGRLAIIECKKEDSPFGPPMHMRNAPGEVEAAIIPYGFEKLNYIDLGYNYMIQFTVKC